MLNIIIYFRDKEENKDYAFDDFSEKQRTEMMERQIEKALAKSGLPYELDKSA